MNKPLQQLIDEERKERELLESSIAEHQEIKALLMLIVTACEKIVGFADTKPEVCALLSKIDDRGLLDSARGMALTNEALNNYLHRMENV